MNLSEKIWLFYDNLKSSVKEFYRLKILKKRTILDETDPRKIAWYKYQLDKNKTMEEREKDEKISQEVDDLLKGIQKGD